MAATPAAPPHTPLASARKVKGARPPPADQTPPPGGPRPADLRRAPPGARAASHKGDKVLT